MVYNGTYTSEAIVFHAAGCSEEKHFIELVKHIDEPVFRVSCCCDPDWNYEFYMGNPSDYERVKFNIMEQIFEAESIEELLVVLAEMFEDGFADILIDDGCDCNGSCENCTCRD